MDEFISKKEVLEKYGISYGALYRWKRMGLIPEDWFVKRSAVTGQETFFYRETICQRIETILQLKDTLSLEDIAEKLNGKDGDKSPAIKIYTQSGTTEFTVNSIKKITLTDKDGNEINITDKIINITKQE